ncbi:MAG: BTAD domain-containing putative transcriptional regulator, partial [Thermocrispum sp.]
MEFDPFGDVLRRWRLQEGLSQRALAARAGVSERSVRNVEHGAVRPQQDIARRLADAAGLDRTVLSVAGGLRLGVLGRFVVEAAGAPAEVGPAKQRALLGLLAVQPGVAVSTPEIVDALWADAPPASCVNLVHTYCSRLRKALAPYGDAVRIVSTPTGFRLLADRASLDLWQFQALLDQADRATDDAEALGHLEQAVDCWRGEVLADLPGHVREQLAVVAVHRQRLAAVLRYADVSLHLGRCDVERIRRLADLEPLHEGLHARLMLALAADGQQAVALHTYDIVRQRLRDELGVDPCAALQDAQLSVLRGDPPGGERPTVTMPKPAELPPDVSGYVGRAEELAILDAAVTRAGSPAILAIDGMPGVGKTALAVHWAHRVARRFPDGQLYVNLRGYDRSAPVHPQQALARFLRALGVAADRIPADEDEAANVYRSLLAERRMLVMLDNAGSVEQVRPLLPGGPDCFVVVTSRERLTALAAERDTGRITLGVLRPDEARGLITGMIGTDHEPEAVNELARICGYLPLVLRVAAANISDQPHGSAQTYAAAVRERGNHAGSAAVYAAFDVSYERLPPLERGVFPLLGLAPGDFTADVVATLADRSAIEARDVLHRLCAANLLQASAAGRFRLHDLLRDYAASLVARLPATDRRAATTRMLDYYLQAADAACARLYPHVQSVAPSPGRPRVLPFRADTDGALAWLDAERPNLLEIVSRCGELEHAEYAWLLIDVLRGFLSVRGCNTDGIVACRAALKAARAAADKRAEA